jgi:hypothetical protein
MYLGLIFILRRFRAVGKNVYIKLNGNKAGAFAQWTIDKALVVGVVRGFCKAAALALAAYLVVPVKLGFFGALLAGHLSG